MIYFSGFLVLVGLLFFLYAVLVASEERPLFERSKTVRTTRKVRKAMEREPSLLKAKLFNFKYPMERNPTEMDQKIRKERVMAGEIRKAPREPELEKIFQDPIPFAELAEDELENPEPIVLQTEPMVAEPKMVLQITGTLFLDFGRKIPFDFKKFKNIEWTEESFLHFKRVGKVKMLEHDGVVEFHAGQSTHELELDHVEQIVFYENAFTLVPINPTMPVSLMFSSDTGKFKEVVTQRFQVV